jgi:hypothetical protein
MEHRWGMLAQSYERLKSVSASHHDKIIALIWLRGVAPLSHSERPFPTRSLSDVHGASPWQRVLAPWFAWHTFPPMPVMMATLIL